MDQKFRMKETKKALNIEKTWGIHLKRNLRHLIIRFKQLHGNPHYIAMGMAVGVFVSVTPTFPLHTFLAVTLAFILRGSKAAAAIGVWFANPLTMPFFYLVSYKAGIILLGISSPFDTKYHSILELLQLGLDITFAMITGGALLGFFPGIAAYFITRRIFTTMRLHEKTIDKKTENR